MQIFDRKFYFRQLQRSQKVIHKHDFIHKHISEKLYEKLDLLNTTFDRAIILGHLSCNINKFTNHVKQYRYIEYDEENLFQLNNCKGFNEKFDLIISILSLHYVNNPLDSLINYQKLLNKNGVFIGVFFGGNTLHELRIALQEAELILSAGASPRIIPMIDVKDAARLIQIAGYNLPVSDIDTIEVNYLTLHKLLHDLKGMGQSNALILRNKKYPGREFFKVTEECYRKKFSKNHRLITTFDLITIMGVCP